MTRFYVRLVNGDTGFKHVSEQAVCDGLTALRLSGMKEEFEHQQTHPAFSEQPFSDRVLSLVNSEVERRKNNRINRLIKNAGCHK